MTTNYLQIKDNISTNINPNRLERLESIFESLTESYDFIGGIYIVGLSNNICLSNSSLRTNPSGRTDKKRHNFLFSNVKMKKLRNEFANKAIKYEPNMKGVQNNDYLIFRYEGRDEGTLQCRKVLDKYGVRSRFFYRYHDEENPEFTVCFLLMSNKHPDMLTSFCNSVRAELLEELECFHNLVFSSRKVAELNPLTGMGLINNKGHEVIKLIAEGHSRASIAKILFITERGVDYHITKLKIFFDAKNNAELIAKSFKYRIIS